jgi:hypothetical protein
MSKWRFTSTSVQGTSHVESNIPCQDFSLCKLVTHKDGSDSLVLVASDGAGSATYSDEGSKIVCECFLDKLTRYIEQGWSLEQADEDVVGRWIIILTRYAAQTIKRVAKERGVEKREFAATLVLAIVGQKKSIFLQLGDGGIVINTAENYEPVFWPQSGEYANMTYFVTDDSAIKNLQFKIVNQTINEIALFTDGIQGLALKYDTQSAYAPFFRPQFEYLRQVSDLELPLIKDQLAAFLNSKSVNDRTNDDKTLILACRLNDPI